MEERALEAPAVQGPYERRIGSGLLLLFCASILFTRVYTYDEPLERDIAIYATIGQELLEGRSLYSDLWDIKAPAIYVANAAARWVTGSGRSAIFLLNLALALITLAGVVRFARSMPSPWAWAWAGAFWCVVSASLSLQANQPNVETYLNAGRVWFFTLLFEDRERPPSAPRAWVAGAILALCSLFKQIVVAEAVVLGLPLLHWYRMQAFWALARMAAVTAAAWLATFAYFMARGTFDAFYEIVFEFTSHYAGDLGANLRQALTWDRIFPGFAVFLWPLQVLAATALIAGGRRDPRLSVALLAFAFGGALQTALPGRFFPHYYQLWLPPLVLAAAWAAAALRPAKLGAGACAAALAWLLYSQLPNFRLTPEEWSRRKYGEEFVLAHRLGAEIRGILVPGETLYHWGTEGVLNFETDTSPPSGLFFATPLYEPEFRRRLTVRILADLRRSPPDLLVVSQAMEFPPGRPGRDLARWMEQNYAPIPRPRYEGVLLAARKGSALHARAVAMPAR